MAERLAADAATRAVRVLGSDISGPAVTAAARRYRGIGWSVANNTHLPLVRGTVGVITSLFGFAAWVPWATLQDAGQSVVALDAGPRHLLELREAIYARVRVHDAPSDAAALAAGYERIDERRVSCTCRDVPGAILADVLAMTPHAPPRGARGAGRRRPPCPRSS